MRSGTETGNQCTPAGGCRKICAIGRLQVEKTRLRSEKHLETASRRILRLNIVGADAESFRQLFDSAPDGIFVASPDGRYTDVNAAGCRLLGCTREDLIGRSVTEFVAPAELARQAALTKRLIEGGAEVSEWRLRRLDGTYVPVELSATVLPNGDLLAFVRDIRERLEVAEARHLSEAKYAGIVSISADAIVTIDDAGRISLFNEGAQHVFGYSKGR